MHWPIIYKKRTLIRRIFKAISVEFRPNLLSTSQDQVCELQGEYLHLSYKKYLQAPSRLFNTTRQTYFVCMVFSGIYTDPVSFP